MKLPVPPKPVGEYQAVIIRNGIGFVSGQFPMLEDKLVYSGKIGADVSQQEATEAMRLAAYNVLSQISLTTDNFKKLDGLLRLEGHLSCSTDFNDPVKILDEASNIFNQLLGEKGKHTRTLFLHERLPMNSSIELCVTFSEIPISDKT